MTNQDYIRKNALIYDRYKCNFKELTSEQIDHFRFEVNRAYAQIPVRIDYVKGQPYANVDELTHDIRENNLMQISTDNNDSELLPDILNLRFRAVHDYWHYLLQAPFTAMGEKLVFDFQKKHHSEGLMRKILFSEVVLQACHAEYFGTFGTQKVIILNERI